MKSDAKNEEIARLKQCVEEMKKKIDEYKLEEARWKEEEQIIRNLITDREKEIKTLREMIHNLYYNM